MIEVFPVKITAFNLERTIRVHLPEDYQKFDKTYPVLYMHDGQNLFSNEDAATKSGQSLELKKYLEEHPLDVIIVGIDSTEERANELCPWENGAFSRDVFGRTETYGGKGKDYVDFIVNELKPVIDEKYRTIVDRTFMVGISLGGLISVYAACTYPNIFTRIAGISTAFYANQEKMEELVSSVNLANVERFYLDCGTTEAGEDAVISENFLQSNEKVVNLLMEKEVKNFRFEVITGAKHHYDDFKKRIPDVLQYLLGD
ncbi:esterase [Lottiidibacillus patelloidae]|uniref:Esterase n=1 Tax=Lottiidibacillus patelloidae TaxID=2670334 RepID=A0A263BTB8_9BACI|nr:alpha/beta hydrolase-fold protein [Lottiidibacillus patelloidae]OZM56963.1 esterase [Lottiidibacillus patelloidae]